VRLLFLENNNFFSRHALKKQMANKKTTKTKVAVGVGLGLVAAAAAAAGAYFLYGPKGARNRRRVKSWTLKAKGEVLEQLEALKAVNEKKYHQVVDAVARRYRSLKNVDPRELQQLVKELKGHWRNISKHLARSSAVSRRSKAASRRKGR